jgi:hypothetical protein
MAENLTLVHYDYKGVCKGCGKETNFLYSLDTDPNPGHPELLSLKRGGLFVYCCSQECAVYYIVKRSI